MLSIFVLGIFIFVLRVTALIFLGFWLCWRLCVRPHPWPDVRVIRAAFHERGG